MKVITLNLKDYTQLLSSDAPAPGGGAASALAGAQGMALTLMVVNLTLGKEKYADCEALCLETKEKGESLMAQLTAGIDKDKEAFEVLSAAYKLPKEKEEEKKCRSQGIGAATLVATKVPIDAMTQGVDGLKLTLPLVGNSNKGAVSDLGAAAVNLLSCVKGSWLNVLINLPGIQDQTLAKELKEKGASLLAEAEDLSKKIYAEVEKTIRG
ncbi:MAG: cyclodeaminase/cyclohydrolase family protein [Anaerovorax sp.]